MSRLVFFDIDGTLVPLPGTEPRFARWLLRGRRLGPRQLLACGWFLLRYFFVFGPRVLQKNKAWLAGLAPRQVDAWAREFVAGTLLEQLYQPALTRLRQHLAAGDHVVLLSGTPDFLAGALAATLGASESVGAVCARRGDRYCARPPERHPHGLSKVAAAREVAARTGLALGEAVAYGDSINDAHLFRAVGHCVTVMPDRRLRAAASGESWESLT